MAGKSIHLRSLPTCSSSVALLSGGIIVPSSAMAPPGITGGGCTSRLGDQKGKDGLGVKPLLISACFLLLGPPCWV